MVENEDGKTTLTLDVTDKALQSDRVFESPRFLIDLSIFIKPKDKLPTDTKQEPVQPLPDVVENNVPGTLSDSNINTVPNEEERFKQVRDFVEYGDSQSWQAIEDRETIVQDYISYLERENKTDELDILKGLIEPTGQLDHFKFCE